MRRLAHALLGLVLAACSGAPEPTQPPLDDATFAALQTMHFAGADAVLTGFAPPDDDASMREGDAALLGVEVRRDDTIERQLLLLEVARIPWVTGDDVKINGVSQPNGLGLRLRMARTFNVTWSKKSDAPGATPVVEQRSHEISLLQMRLQRFDAEGRLLQASEPMLYEEPLATGFWPYAIANATPRDTDLAFCLTLTLQELATQDDVLQDLLFRVVDKPSLWSIATNLGAHVNMKWTGSAAETPPIAFPGFPDEVRRSALELVVNGDTAAWVTLFAAKPHAGTAACGGLVGAIAQHPTDSGRIGIVRLLATRRGAAR